MIIPIQVGEEELRLRLSYGGRPIVSAEGLRLVIQPPPPAGKCFMLPSEMTWEGCWVMGRPEKPADSGEWPALVYPAFEVSDEGEIIFRFDARLRRRPPGRYLGRVEFNGQQIAIMQFDLWPGPWSVEGAGLISVTDCEEATP